MTVGVVPVGSAKKIHFRPNWQLSFDWKNMYIRNIC